VVPGVFDTAGAGGVTEGYGSHARAYRRAGWKGVLYLPPRAKLPPPEGCTGREGRWLTDEDISEWRLRYPGHNLCLRLDLDIIGVDRDVYKVPDVLERLEEFLGCKLPPTWYSTSRDDGSGVYLYRVPPSMLDGKRWKSNPVSGCEIVQFDHRYVMAAPSIHPEGRRYYWRDDAGELARRPPSPDDAADFPLAAIDALLEDTAEYAEREPVEFDLTGGDPSPKVVATLERGLDACTGDKGSRHDRVLPVVIGLVREAEQGEPGVAPALGQLRERFVAEVAPDRPKGERQAAAEFDDMIKDSADIVAKTEPPKNGEGIVVTDLANARRLVDRHGDDLLYVPRVGWFVWDSRRFAEDVTGEAARRAKDTVDHLVDLLREVQDTAERKRLFADWLRSQHASSIEGMLTLARSEPAVVATVDQLDADPWLLNLENGTLDLRERVLRPHDRADRITKLAPARYDPDAAAPRFGAFLERVLPNEQVREYMQRVLSMGLTGDVSEQRLPIAHGTGANGKSTLLGAARGALGDYACQLAAETLLFTKFPQHPTNLMELRGARLAVSVEVEEGRRLAESLVKQLTGGELVVARYMRQNFVSFAPTHTIVLACNSLPAVWGSDNAIWRRIAVVPFDVHVPESEQDKGLPDKLREERAGVLNWLLDGFAAWQRDGLNPPEEVTARTAQYRQEQDHLGGFLTACCDIDTGYTASAKELRERYETWCGETGLEPLSKTAFGTRIGERFPTDKSRRRRLGLRIRSETPLTLDDLA
jgi:putative DNA primase/helicase